MPCNRGQDGQSWLSYNGRRAASRAHPIVVMNEEVKESSENRSRRQDLPTPAERLKQDVSLRASLLHCWQSTSFAAHRCRQ